MEQEHHDSKSKHPFQQHKLTKKEELNNHIVSMRKWVQQSRVRVIHKLTKEIAKLRQRKGEESEVQKAQRKADRLVEDINILKGLRRDEVSIFALQDKLSYEEHVKNPEITSKTRALARLSHHPSIRSAVKQYHNQNPHWALQIPVLLEKRKAKQKLTVKKLEKKEKLKAEAKKGKLPDSDTVDPEAETVKPGPLLSKSTKAKKTPKAPVPINKVEGALTIKLLKDLSDLDKEAEPKESKKRKLHESTTTADQPKADTTTDEGEVPAPPKRIPRSSFFLGGVDEPVTAKETKTVEKARRPKDPSVESKPVFRKGKLVSKPPRFDKRSKSTDNWKDKNFNKSQYSRSSGANQFPVGSRPKPDVPVQPAEKLHPSWEAKKRQAVALTTFQGKKKVFDNDD